MSVRCVCTCLGAPKSRIKVANHAIKLLTLVPLLADASAKKSGVTTYATPEGCQYARATLLNEDLKNSEEVITVIPIANF